MAAIRTATLGEGQAPAGLTTTVYTVPLGFHARLTHLLLQSAGAASACRVELLDPAGTRVYGLFAANAPANTSVATNISATTFQQNNGPVLEAGASIRVVVTGAAAVNLWVSGTQYED